MACVAAVCVQPYTLHTTGAQLYVHQRSPAPPQLFINSMNVAPLSWMASFKSSRKELVGLAADFPDSVYRHALMLIEAAWTRRSRGQPSTSKNKKSWKQRTEKYMKPFILDILVSKKYIHAKVMHRVTSKVVSVATTSAKDLRDSLPSLTDVNACKTIGKLIAERSREADVFAVTYTPRKGEKLEGKLATIIDTIVDNGIALI
eukprot:c8694_g1_i1 orf=242-850(-)